MLPAIPPRARAVLSKEMVDEYYREEGAKVLDPVRKYLERSCIFPKERLEVGHPGDIIASIAEDESTTSSSWAPTATGRWGGW